MKTFTINGETGCSLISVGASIGDFDRYAGSRQCVIVTDTTVSGLHGNRLGDKERIVIDPGEESKTLSTVEQLYERFMSLGLDRDSLVVAVGGGVVSDIAGFAAATFMRGVTSGIVPTTLLAQVDASIGGKTGVNLHGYKNMVGTFSQPEFVLCDPAFLSTLPESEVRCGLAEIVKSALIADPALFETIEKSGAELFSCPPGIIVPVIEAAVAVKVNIVNEDEKESGPRRMLNFGHTLGHAIERNYDLPHGEAVSMGMVLAARLSVRRGMLDAASCDRITGVLSGLGLPVEMKFEKEKILDAVLRDKKRQRWEINFVLLKEIGHAVIEKIGIDELEEVLDDLR